MPAKINSSYTDNLPTVVKMAVLVQIPGIQSASAVGGNWGIKLTSTSDPLAGSEWF